ncbi:MAG: Cof-type HAD-IIB family hydrolase [Candidatus Gastranaerophilales bacterium]|nr:Cof-type HAD-IIB family hydrolase [Candidatus Gastranaerophilales bacterium]
MVDLHVHSNKSDGTFSPRELVDYALEKGLSAFALTDHDTVDGLDEAIAYAKEKGGVCVIPGIEFSTEYEGKDVHVVGLAIDHNSPSFAAALQEFVDSRHKRNQKMCDLLREGTGMDISYEKLLAEFPNAVITRAHYAKYMLTHGYVKSMKDAFDQYIGDDCPYFIPREKITPDQAVELILAADGIPVLAHPILYHMSDERLEKLVAGLKEVGLIGIEAIYSTYNAAEERQIIKLAQKYHLLISGGSDFHGSNKPGLDLAVGYGKLYVHDQVWEDLKNSRNKLLFTDMDGTLLRNDSTVSPGMKEALNRMTEAGHHLILSSGRPLPSILEVREQAGLNYPHMLIISNNGALIYDCDAKAPILELRVCQKDIAVIIDEAHALGLHIHGYTDSEIVCLQENDELRYYRRRIHLPIKCVEDIAAALPLGSYKLQTIHLTDKARLIAFRERLLSHTDLAERIQVIFSNDQYLEILPKEAGKGAALRYVTDYLPALRTHTFAAGDAENDISMIAAAHVGIAMANASPEVKRCADIVTKGTNQEDGLLDILEKYHFY